MNEENYGQVKVSFLRSRIFFSVHRWMEGGHMEGAGPGRHVWPGMKELARNLHARNWSKRTNAGDADGFRVRERGCGCGCGCGCGPSNLFSSLCDELLRNPL